MSTKFLMATLVSGEKVVAEFSKLGGSGQGYATKVMAGVKPFNAWRTVSTVHPASGEAALVRQREMFSGRQIVSIGQVKPKDGLEQTHGYNWTNFEPVVEIQKGRYGMWVAPSPAPEGVVAGMAYPIHRDEADHRRYAILKVAQEPTTVGGEPVPEQRLYIDAAPSMALAGDTDAAEARQAPVTRGPLDADEDEDLDLDDEDDFDDE